MEILNEQLAVSVSARGAELTSLVNRSTGIEHLWQGDPSVWGWHAPNLFPVVGGNLDNQIWVDGVAYPMGRHGFARQSEFTLLDRTDSSVSYRLTDSEESRKAYPYRFVFDVCYALRENQLIITYRVQNPDPEPLFVSVGAHPAFNVPFQANEAYEDYWLEFAVEEPLTTHLLSDEGYFTGQTEPIALIGNRLPLTRHLFDRDALVIKELQSRSVSIRSKNHRHSVKVTFDGFPYLGLWAKPGASFVCIEPWLGYADSVGAPRELAEREAIQRVQGLGTFEASFSITI